MAISDLPHINSDMLAAPPGRCSVFAAIARSIVLCVLVLGARDSAQRSHTHTHTSEQTVRVSSCGWRTGCLWFMLDYIMPHKCAEWNAIKCSRYSLCSHVWWGRACAFFVCRWETKTIYLELERNTKCKFRQHGGFGCEAVATMWLAQRHSHCVFRKRSEKRRRSDRYRQQFKCPARSLLRYIGARVGVRCVWIKGGRASAFLR